MDNTIVLPSDRQRQLLQKAAREGKPSTVDLLIARGADVNHRNQAGASALDWARRTNEKAMVDRLQRAGAR